jgi:hypothetical protein
MVKQLDVKKHLVQKIKNQNYGTFSALFGNTDNSQLSEAIKDGAF